MTTTIAASDSIISSQKYIDTLRGAHATAKSTLAEACAQSDKANTEYQAAKKWKAQIEKYIENIKNTFEQAQTAHDKLTQIGNHAALVCTNVTCFSESIKLLIKMAEATAEATELLKMEMKELMDRIDCLNNPVLVPTQSLMKYLLDLQSKIDEALKCTLDAIKATMEVLKIAEVLELMICNNDEKKSLVDTIEEMKVLMKEGKMGALGSATSSHVASCGKAAAEEPNCEKEIQPSLKLEGSSSPYFEELCAKLEEAKALYEYKDCVNKHYKTQKDCAQANADSIGAALEAALATKAC